jgi:hypothetical protein
MSAPASPDDAEATDATARPAALSAPVPFDWASMAALCMGMLAHSVVFTAPLPFVAFMVVDFDMAATVDEAGYSAGWITGAFMIGRTSSGLLWGMASDRWGRRPCLLVTMFNVCLFGLLLGFSTNFTLAICFRLAIGLGNGFMGIAKTCISEVFPKEHELRAFGMLNGVWGLGLIAGPAIGGLLSRPHVQYPLYFPADSVWGRFPYLLPCMVCAGLAAAAFGGIYWSLPETAGAAYLLQRAADQLAVQGKGGDVELATAGPGLGAATASSVFVITSDEEEAEAEDEEGDVDGGDGVGEEIKDAEGLSFAGKHCRVSAAHDDNHVPTTTVASTSTTSTGSTNSTARRLWQRLLNGPASPSASSSAFARLPEESGHGAPTADGPESTPSSSSSSSGGESARSPSGPPTTVWGMLCDPQLGFIYGIYTAFSFAVRAQQSIISHDEHPFIMCSRRPL